MMAPANSRTMRADPSLDGTSGQAVGRELFGFNLHGRPERFRCSLVERRYAHKGEGSAPRLSRGRWPFPFGARRSFGHASYSPGLAQFLDIFEPAKWRAFDPGNAQSGVGLQDCVASATGFGDASGHRQVRH
jgi:hypothetical protein